MITVSIEPFKVVEDNQHLIAEHWNEVASKDGGRQLNVDWDTFNLYEKTNHLVTIVARDDGEVVGYAVFIIMKQLHAMDYLMAHNDALFLKKEHRKGRAGIMLIKESNKILGELFPGILVAWHVKPHMDFSPILIKLGYSKLDTIYAIKAGN